MKLCLKFVSMKLQKLKRGKLKDDVLCIFLLEDGPLKVYHKVLLMMKIGAKRPELGNMLPCKWHIYSHPMAQGLPGAL